jgi:hypothetical protein
MNAAKKAALIAALVLIALPAWLATARACDMQKACQDVFYCAYQNLNHPYVEALRKALHDDDPTGINTDTTACQAAVGNPGDWKNNADSCNMIDIGRKARAGQCTAWSLPPQPPGPRPKYCCTNGSCYEIGHLAPSGVCQTDNSFGGCSCGSYPGNLQ